MAKKIKCNTCNDMGIVNQKIIRKINTGEKDENKKIIFRNEVMQSTIYCPKGCSVKEKKGQIIKNIINEILI